MSKIFIWGQVDLPPVPDHFLRNVENFQTEKFIIDMGYGRTFIKNGQIKSNSTYGKWTIPPGEFLDWIRQHVPPWPQQEPVSIQKNSTTSSAAEAMFPVHHDVKRMFALNYMVTTGGRRVFTSWYKDQGQPVLRSLTKPIGVQSDTGPVDYNTLTLLESAQFDTGRWYLIRTNVLHDVDHIQSERASVTVPYFDHSVVDYFKNLNKFLTIKEIDDDSGS